MIIPTASLSGWKDLQEKTKDLFNEMGYIAVVSKRIPIAGRGRKEIDVFVTDPNASYNKKYLIECKHWESNVPQEVVHAFKTVMEESGANTGFIVSKVGFQQGAHEAARFTNIKLLNFEDLQNLYGAEWLRKQKEKLDFQIQRLKQIHTLHFDQWNLLGFHNNKYFRTDKQHDELSLFHHWITHLIIDATGPCPKSHTDSTPIRISSDPKSPRPISKGWHEFPTIRAYFQEMTLAAQTCADAFDKFFKDATSEFKGLSEAEQDAIDDKVLRAIDEELPIRTLKRRIPPQEYNRIINLLQSKKDAS